MLTMALVGDVMLGRGVNEALRTKGPEEPWGDVLSLLEAADLRIINLECAITNHKQPWMRTPKVFHFRADPSAVEVLRVARVDGCSLANNHTLDFEEQGLLDTLKHLEAAGISYAGAGRNQEEAAQPALLEARTDHIRNRVALLAFTDNEPTFAAGTDRPGTNYLPVSLEPAVLARVEAAVTTARAVLDRGADIYYGHSAHIFQGVEIYNSKPILYDTGDFIDDYAIDPKLRNDWSFLFRISLEEAKLRRLELFPVTLHYAQVESASGAEREAIFDRMEGLSCEMGTAFTRREDQLVLEL